MIGKTLGHYQVVEKIGQGGMGVVFLARDTLLDRQVALKFLPDAFADDPERLARFEREAKLLACLNHPNIAAINGLETAGGKRFLALEFVAGETMARRIAKGPLPVDEALELCRQIAEGLEAAHEKGIIHRDLKPANVKITSEGKVKILDFGLAKAFHEDQPAVDASQSPTITDRMTGSGVILGTASYMSPEQARGAAVDKRGDIWAFGVMLFEMLTGRRCFEGETVTDILAAIVKSEPDWTGLPAETPGRVRDLLQRCLAKERKHRLHDIADGRLEIAAIQASPADFASVGRAGERWPRQRELAISAGALLVGIAIGAAILWGSRTPSILPAAGVVHAAIGVNPAEELNSGSSYGTLRTVFTPGGARTSIAWTPDGRNLVFVGRRGGVQQLYVRPLDQPEAHPLAGTEDAQVPAVSADGQWVAFWAGGAIRKVPLSGGPAAILVEGIRDPLFGMAWSDAGLLLGAWDAAGFILGTGTGGIYRVTPGQPPKAVTTLQQGELAHILPQWLPSGNAFLYTARSRMYTWSDDRVVAIRIATGERKLLLPDAVDARYAAGHLVFLRRGLLMAVPFDADRLEVRGEPVALVGNVIQALGNVGINDVTGAGHFSVSPAGSLAYVQGRQKLYQAARIVMVDRRGVVAPLPMPANSCGMNVRVSPDGRQLANSVYSLSERSIWVYDTERGSFIANLAAGGEVGANRSWTPDGKRLTFSWFRPDGIRELAWQVADGSTPPERLSDIVAEPGGWTPDGQELIGAKDEDIWILADRSGKAGARPVVQSRARERWPAVSPDGRWLAYGSDTSGRFEVYVQPYTGGPRTPVSLDGGESPLWHPKGGELFFLTPGATTGDGHLMAAAVESDNPLRFGKPQPLFYFRSADLRFYSLPFPGYDITPDGQHFLVTQPIPESPSPPVTQIPLILNWIEEVKAKFPIGSKSGRNN